MYSIREADIDELNIQEWNDLFLKSEVCDAFQTYEWAVVLRNSMNVKPVFLLVRDKGATIGGVMFFKKRMFGISDCYEVRGGPLYVAGNKAVVTEKIIKVLNEKKARSVYLLCVPFPPINFGFRETFQAEGYYPFPFRTIIIDLKRPLNDIWRALDKRARWGVRKAERLGVKVKAADTWQEWEQYYRLHVLHSKERQYPTEPYGFFNEMFKLTFKNMSRLFIAEYDKRIVAGSLFLVCKENMVFLQNASLSAFLKYNPNNLLQWRSIEWARENGVTTYDINGLPLEETSYLRGVYDYKKRWDGHIQWYYYYINRRLLYHGVHLIRANSFAWNLFSHLRNYGVI